MNRPWRTFYTPTGVDDAVRGLAIGILLPLIFLFPAWFTYLPDGSRPIVALTAFGLVAVRAARQINVHVAVSPDGVKIANIYRTRTLTWEQISAVGIISEELDGFTGTSLREIADELGLPHDQVILDQDGQVRYVYGIVLRTVDERTVRVGCATGEALAALTTGLRLSAEAENQRRRRSR